MSKKCEKCGNEFPLEAIIEGKARNLQRRKYCLKCSPFGRHNTKDLTTYELIDGTAKCLVSKCKKHGTTEFVREGRGTYRCKKCRSENVIKNRRKRKQKLVEYFGGKCELCGYSKCQEALQFHHVHENKSFGIAANGMCRDWEAVLAEAKKCVLVCANCHAEVGNSITEIPTQLFERCLL